MVQTEAVLKSAGDKLFDFVNQKHFLEKMEILSTSLSRTKCQVAYTNMRTSLFYVPGNKSLQTLSRFKVYPTTEIEEKFRVFWKDFQDEQYDLAEKEHFVEKKKTNVKR